MGLSSALGRYQYLKGKSGPYVEMIRAWVTPAAAAGGLAKYLGLQSRWAIVIAILVPIAVEGFGFLLGRFLYDHGGVEAEYQLALDKDPYRKESLRLAAETAKETRQTRVIVVEIYRTLRERAQPPA